MNWKQFEYLLPIIFIYISKETTSKIEELLVIEIEKIKSNDLPSLKICW